MGSTSSPAAYTHPYAGVPDYQKPDPVGMTKYQSTTPLASRGLHTLFTVNSETASTPGGLDPPNFLFHFMLYVCLYIGFFRGAPSRLSIFQ